MPRRSALQRRIRWLLERFVCPQEILFYGLEEDSVTLIDFLTSNVHETLL